MIYLFKYDSTAENTVLNHISVRPTLSVGRVVHGASCPWGELSLGRAVPGASCPWGELSMGRVVPGASCLWGEMTVGRVVVGRVVVGRVVRGASFDGESGPVWKPTLPMLKQKVAVVFEFFNFFTISLIQVAHGLPWRPRPCKYHGFTYFVRYNTNH